MKDVKHWWCEMHNGSNGKEDKTEDETKLINEVHRTKKFQPDWMFNTDF